MAEARIAGADAVLVMLSLLSDAEARAMIDEAGRLGMDCLVEVHDEDEMHRAIALGAPLIGINNRDLRDLSIDLATTERLAPLAPGRLLVSESGIGGRGDVDRLAPSGRRLPDRQRADAARPTPRRRRGRCCSAGSSCAGSTARRT